MTKQEILIVLPEIVVSLMACFILVLDLYLPATQKQKFGYGLSLVTLAVGATLSLVYSESAPVYGLNGLVLMDGVSAILKAGICILTGCALVYSRSYATARGLWQGEFFTLALFGVVGMMVMTASNHLLSLYVGLELLALCLYAMVALRTTSTTASEAAMKYFVLGALASGILLYGMSLLYGLTGTLYLNELSESMGHYAGSTLPRTMALILVLVGLLFKIGAVPFHMWVPDVYEGSPTSTTVYLATAPKLAGFAMILRLLADGLESLATEWQGMLLVVSILSLALGNVIAIAQKNIKRMLAYSAIAHVGFFLLGILTGEGSGYASAMAYILIYAVVTLGAFGVILVLSSEEVEADLIEDYSGLSRSHPWAAFIMLLLMLSLAGIPPTVGFYAKLSVLQAVVNAELTWAAVIAVVFSVVGAFYYLRIVKVMYFDEPRTEQLRLQFSPKPDARILLTINGLAVVVLMPWIGGLTTLCEAAIGVLF
ncbi:MAG TPA: NADH-quinone oxidoreductase subunit NuoN [Gammaproteobacteria bacterium]|nr:NADH-quinone oxidoreductase subunit NuoN [Gammaproteobacteria bacterium]